ncbi:MAG: tetratricopeptide repeat protein [Spirochaetota bacterium]
MKRKIYTLFLIFFLAGSLQSSGAESLFSLYLSPALEIPLGGSAGYFGLAGSAGLSGEFRLAGVPLYFSGGLGYGLHTIKNAPEIKQSVSLIRFGAGAGMAYLILPWLGVKAGLTGGYYYGFMNELAKPGGGGNPYLAADAGLHFYPFRSLSLGLGTGYTNYFGLFQGMHVSIATGYHFPAGVKETVPAKTPVQPEPLKTAPAGKTEQKRTVLELSALEFENVFPVFHKYYDNHPVARAVLANTGETPVTEIKVSFLIKQYMDAPKACEAPKELKAGESKDIELYALFTDRVLEITEATKVAAEIQLEYSLNGEVREEKVIETIRIYDRNALTWDDDRKAAAFITAKDPAVLTFAKNVAGMVKGKGSRAVNPNLLSALAIHEALLQYGLTYVVDPKTPYAEFSQQQTVVDFLQFPRQSLEYRAGDCDDLSILYSALIEAVGVETAFITVPGHILMAFALDMQPEEARKSFLRADELIFMNEKAWIPIEVTEREGGFLKAWQTGAKEWRENSARQQAGFYPVHEAWRLYEPVGLPGAEVRLSLPERDKVVSAYLEEVVRFIDLEIYPQVAKLQAELQKGGATEKTANKLGALYARYGLMERAQREFEKALIKGDYIPALLNLGNIYYLDKKMDKALGYYERAYKKEPENPNVLLCMARVNHELENYGLVKRTYEELKRKDPDLALRFAYLDLRGEEASRAAEISQAKEVMLWQEE